MPVTKGKMGALPIGWGSVGGFTYLISDFTRKY